MTSNSENKNNKKNIGSSHKPKGCTRVYRKPMKAKKCSHQFGWSSKHHYMGIGGQCGQSCPCCRAEVFLKKIDPDAWFGACQICLRQKK